MCSDKVILLQLQRSLEALEGLPASAGKTAGGKKFLENLKEKTRVELEYFRKCAEEKRQNERVGGGGDGENKRDFISGLPEELVEMIVGNLKRSKDLLSCYRALSIFRKILEPTKEVWMLQEVLPHIVHYLDPEEVFKCRQVCQAWKDQIDDFLGEVPVQETVSSSEMYTYTSKIKQDLVKDKFDGMQMEFVTIDGGALEFLEQVKGREEENPFPGRRVSFKWLDDPDYEGWEKDNAFYAEEFWGKVIKLLEKFGEQIWECEFLLESSADDDRVVTIVRDCLKLTPNLKKVSFVAVVGWNRDTHVSPELMEELNVNSLPDLPHLVSLSLNYVPRYFTELIFSKYAEQLQTLKLNCFDFNVVAVTSLYDKVLENLSNLHVLVNGEIWTDLEELKTALVGVPLKTFWIDVRSSRIRFTEILEVLQNFSSTLQHLKIEYSFTDDPCFISKPSQILKATESLYLPHLKIFQMSGSFDSMNYLLCFPSLEYIALMWTQSDKGQQLLSKVRHGEILNVYGYLDRFYKSNVWTLLPSLKDFKCKVLKEEEPEFDPYPDYDVEAERLVYQCSNTREMYEFQVKTGTVGDREIVFAWELE